MRCRALNNVPSFQLYLESGRKSSPPSIPFLKYIQFHPNMENTLNIPYKNGKDPTVFFAYAKCYFSCILLTSRYYRQAFFNRQGLKVRWQQRGIKGKKSTILRIRGDYVVWPLKASTSPWLSGSSVHTLFTVSPTAFHFRVLIVWKVLLYRTW